MSLNFILKFFYCFLFAFVFGCSLSAQDTSVTKRERDTVIAGRQIFTDKNGEFIYPYNKKRVSAMAITNLGGYSLILAGLYSAWYKDYPRSKFHSFNDNAEWLQMDKIGHAYTAYAASRASMELWRRTGISNKKRILLGGFSGAFYLTAVETLDGFSSQWGWSWSDFAANMAGSGLLVAQEFAWDEQKIQLKFSFHRKNYSDPQLNARSNEIFGKSTGERFLKDYNGQTYWLSANLKSFFPGSSIPKWFQLSLGTGAEGLFGARSNYSKDKNGTVTFSRPDLQRYRQWFLAPDIDLTKIKTKKRGIKMALNILSIVKIPTPSLELSKKGFKLNLIHF